MSTTRQAAWTYLSSSLLWVFLALIYGAQAWLGGGMAPAPAAWFAFREWLPWILLSPVIMWIAGKFPWAPGGRIKAALIILVVAMSAVWLAEFSFQIMIGERAGPGRSAVALAGPRDGLEGDGGPVGPPRRPIDENGPAGPGGISGPMRHMMHFHVPICLFVIVLAHAYAYHRLMIERERRAAELTASLAEAKLLALQMQLQPHFLFNALNAVSTLVHTNPQAADDMIANLSELLRRALSAGRQREVTFGQELDYLECYLEIERVRFGQRLEVTWRIDPATRDLVVPVLILQPIVENAVRHGIERRQTDVGRIVIAAAISADRLRVTVTDNGPGLPAVPTAPRGHGIGVGNTQDRLRTLHGGSASLELANAPEGGCIATLELPVRKSTSPRHEN